MSEERNGLECPDCGQKQKQMDIQRINFNEIVIRISMKTDYKNLIGLIALLKGFLK